MQRSHSANLAVKLALFVILVVLFISVVNMQLNLKSLREERADLEVQVDELANEVEKVSYRLSKDVDAVYIERYMREKGYQYPNEILFYYDVQR